MKLIKLFGALLFAVLVILSCKKEVVFDTNCDISISTKNNVIVYLNQIDLNSQIDSNIILTKCGNLESDISISKTFNMDSSEVSLSIVFDNSDRVDDESNNSVTIKLYKLSELSLDDDEDSDLGYVEMRNTINKELENYDFNSKKTMCIALRFIITDRLKSHKDEQVIEDVINNLNANFRNAKLSFRLESLDYAEGSEYFVIEKYNPEVLQYDKEDVLNVYLSSKVLSSSGDFIGGFADFPHKSTNRVVMAKSTLSTAIDKNSAVLTHEFGHFFSLMHTFQKNFTVGLNNGDDVDDTPIDIYDTELKNHYQAYGTACEHSNSSKNASLKNYMSYSLLVDELTECNRLFTTGQNVRIRYAAEKWRSSLTCRGVNQSKIVVTTAPTFSHTSVNTMSKISTFDITNEGDKDFGISTIKAPDGFEIVNDMSLVMKPGDKRVVEVRFAPKIEKTYSGDIEIVHNADNKSHANSFIPVSGTGISQATSNISVSGNLNFGIVEIGSSPVVRELTITKSGSKAFNVSSISLPHSTFSANWNSGTIAGNSYKKVNITFDPKSEGKYIGLITVNNNADYGSNQISVSGEGKYSSTSSITPTNSCATGTRMQVNKEYSVSINTGSFSKSAPIDGQSANGNDVRGFWLSFEVPSSWKADHDVKIYDVSSNFNPVFGIRANCNGPYLGQKGNPTFYDYINDRGDGGDETSDTNLPGSKNGGTPDDIYHIRIYHYDGSETPTITFKIKVE